MTTDEVNRYLHTEIMGKCWHKWDDPLNAQCEKCKSLWEHLPECADNPNYCSDSSPRSLLNEVERAVIDQCGTSRYLDKLCSIVINDFTEQQKAEIQGPFTAVQYTWLATTDQRVRACVEAHKSNCQTT